MKKIIAFVFLMPSLAFANEWEIVQNVMYLKSTNKEATLYVSSHQDGILFENFKQCVDFKNELKEYGSAPNMIINGKKIKIHKKCLYGNLIISPESEKGSHYLVSQIDANKNISISSEDNLRTLLFINKTGHEAIQQLMKKIQQPDDAI